MNLLSVVRNNIRKKLFRSIAILLSVMVVSATLFAVTTIMESVETSLKKGTARLGADIMVVPAKAENEARAALLSGEPSIFYMDSAVENKVRAIEGVKSAAGQIFLQSTTYQCCDIGKMLVIGFDPRNDFTITPWLTEEMKRPLADNEVIMGRGISAYMVGDWVKLYGMEFTIAGMLEETGMKFLDMSVFMPVSAVRKVIENSGQKGVQQLNLPADKISTIFVRVKPDISPSRVAIFIEHDIDGVKAIVSEQVISSVRQQLFVLLRSTLFISIILWVLSLLLIGVVFSMIVNERQREIGLLRAMGATKRNIFQLIMSEAALLSLAGGLAGIVLGGGALYLFRGLIRASLQIPYLWPSVPVFAALITACLCLSFFTGTGAALYPAIRSMKMEPYEAIRRGE